MSLEIGQIVGEYRVIQELGGGGHGRVFKVEHTITRRVEAIKVLADGLPVSEEQRRRFLREIQVQARLCHPNIAAVHHAFWLGDKLVMVMEYIEGRSLQSLLAEGPVKPRVGIGYVSQVLDALSHAHSQGVVHRDVSPANIIVGPAGLIKLTDFGLAKGVMDTSITATGSLVGSLPYMSPEQVRGLEEPDARSDIYSCGVILYQVVTGKKPFDSDSAFTLMRAHVELEPVPPARLNPRVAQPLSDVIMRALAKDPADRFQTAGDFRVALDGVDAIPSTSFPVLTPVPATVGSSGRSNSNKTSNSALIQKKINTLRLHSFMHIVRTQVAGVILGILFVTAVLGAVFWTGGNPKAAEVAPAVAVVPDRRPAPVPLIQPEPEISAREPIVKAPEPAAEAKPGVERTVERTADPPKSAAPRVSARRKAFRPAQRASSQEKIALAEPPPIPAETQFPDGIEPLGKASAPEFPEASTAPPQPAPQQPAAQQPASNRVLRFFGRARALNPFRQKNPKPDQEKQ